MIELTSYSQTPHERGHAYAVLLPAGTDADGLVGERVRLDDREVVVRAAEAQRVPAGDGWVDGALVFVES